MDPTLGAVIADKYRLDRVIGKGGMSTVYAASNQLTGKQVAIKLLKPETGGDGEHGQRLLREAQTASAIDHPNVVNVFDVGRHEGALFLVMELLHGEPLSALLQAGIGDPYDFVKLMLPVLRGVQAAHRAGVVHRDLKPDNILLCRDPHGEAREPKVLDFGISKLTDKLARGQELTREGTVFGTPQYMAPEQMRDARLIDARCDVYALGVIFYRAFSGTYPYDAESIGALAIRIVEGKAQPLHELSSTLDRGLADIVMRALACDPEQRFQSVAELREALAPYADGPLLSSGVVMRESTAQLRESTVRASALASSAPPPRARHSSSGLTAFSEPQQAASSGQAVASALAVGTLPRPSPAVALALESYRARVAAAPDLPTAAIELSELSDVAEPPPLRRGVEAAPDAAWEGTEATSPATSSHVESPATSSHVDTQQPAQEGVVQELPLRARAERGSSRMGLWVAALLLAIGVVAPVLGQLWQGGSGTSVARASRAPAGPLAGKPAEVATLRKKAAPAPVQRAVARAAQHAATEESTSAVNLWSAPSHGAGLAMHAASGASVPTAQQQSLVVQSVLNDEAVPPASSASSSGASASSASASSASASSAVGALATDAGSPAKSEPRVGPARREPLNLSTLERNPYMRR